MSSKISASVHLVFVGVLLFVLVNNVVSEKIDESSTGIIEQLFDVTSDDTSVGRTWGHNVLKRMAFIFLPVMFTLGVISTLLLALTVLSVKNLAVGVILLVVGVSQAMARLFASATVAPVAPPLVHYAHLHSRSDEVEPSFASSWPAAPQGQFINPYAREGTD